MKEQQLKAAEDDAEGIVMWAEAGTPFGAQLLAKSLLKSVLALTAEVRRLKRGEFTPEEFQELCHNRHEKEGCEKEDFYEGCHLFQKNLFGASERDALLKRVAELKEGLTETLRLLRERDEAYRKIALTPNEANNYAVQFLFDLNKKG